ncbi:hypothetical protein ACVBEF_20465 [Glaciimonas sp. GG7]
MPISAITPTPIYASQNSPAPSPETNYLGTIHYLSEAFPHKTSPCYARGAMEGEGVCAAYDINKNNNYLFSLNAQTCVVSTLYNPVNKMGAVIHFDHNIRVIINQTIQTAIELIKDTKGESKTIQATLAGGVWFMQGESIGDPIKESLAQHDIHPSWDHWSFSSCTGRSYGVVLDLATGETNIFEHSIDVIDNFQTPLLREAIDLRNKNQPLSPEQTRADVFMKRVKAPGIAEKYDGKMRFVESNLNQRLVTENEINQKRIPIHLVP